MLVPLIVWLIATTNWRVGLIAIGIGFWLMGIPLAFVMRSRPEDYGMLPDGEPAPRMRPAQEKQEGASESGAAATQEPEAAYSAKQAMKTLCFWQLAAAMGSSQLIISAGIHHIPAISSFGMSREVGGLVILGVSLFSVIGRLLSGFMGDFLDKRKIIAVSFVAQFIGTMIFAYSTEIWHLLLFVVFWGFGFGASIPVRFAMIADMFGRRHYGAVMGTLMTVSTGFSVVGPVFVGWMFDLRGNYRDPFAIIAGFVLLSIPLILTLRPPKQVRAAQAVNG
jgi:cyanate permease